MFSKLVSLVSSIRLLVQMFSRERLQELHAIYHLAKHCLICSYMACDSLLLPPWLHTSRLQ